MARVRVMAVRRLACFSDACEVCSFEASEAASCCWRAFAFVFNLVRCARARASVTVGGRLLVLRCDDVGDEERSSSSWNTMCFKSLLAGQEDKQAARQEAGGRVLVKAGTHVLNKAGGHEGRGRWSPRIEAGCHCTHFRQKQQRLLACRNAACLSSNGLSRACKETGCVGRAGDGARTRDSLLGRQE